jgi:hypothetical protein
MGRRRQSLKIQVKSLHRDTYTNNNVSLRGEAVDSIYKNEWRRK